MVLQHSLSTFWYHRLLQDPSEGNQNVASSGTTEKTRANSSQHSLKSYWRFNSRRTKSTIEKFHPAHPIPKRPRKKPVSCPTTSLLKATTSVEQVVLFDEAHLLYLFTDTPRVLLTPLQYCSCWIKCCCTLYLGVPIRLVKARPTVPCHPSNKRPFPLLTAEGLEFAGFGHSHHRRQSLQVRDEIVLPRANHASRSPATAGPIAF